ncbi:MAG TPA: hypothetical protein VFH48_25690 [Chloroflexota bacterium]|nr:hypothetical protein [Chloroflexota bacterium]
MCEQASSPLRFAESPRGAYIATAHVAPILALLITVTMYVTMPQVARTEESVRWWQWLGPALAYLVIAWSLLALAHLLLGGSTAERSNTGAYADLRDALVTLRSALTALCPNTPVGRSDEEYGSNCCPKSYTHYELRDFEHSLTCDLNRSGPQWALGYGYINLLRRAHRAEESLILVQDLDVVVAGARYDELRIAESSLANKVDLRRRLGESAHFLRHELNRKTGTTRTNGQAPSPTETPCNFDGPPASVVEARTVLRDVRRAINDYRDGIQAGFVRARNHLVAITVITSFALYFLTWVGIIAGVSQDVMKNMAVYYLVGVVIGLFARLNVESQNDAAVDDFGLSATRLISGPLMSGVAAVGGVVVITLLSMTQAKGQGEPLTELLDLMQHPLNLLIAGTFGLTPTLLLDRLKQQADGYKQDLRSSEALQNTRAASSVGAGAG